jgi:hypothetical protein
MDDETGSFSTLLSAGMIIISLAYATIFTIILSIVKALKIKNSYSYAIIALVSISFAAVFINHGNNYIAGIAIYSILFFGILAGIYFLSSKLKRIPKN